MAWFAEVVVNTPIFLPAEDDRAALVGTLHYSIPPRLEGQVQPGQLVRVPLRDRELLGVVVGLSEESPVTETRPILEVVYPDPVLTPLQIDLARWIAETYLTPWVYALRLFLPPRMLAKSEPLWALVPGMPIPPDLSPEQRLLIERLRHGPVPERTLKQGVPRLLTKRVVGPLVERGLVRRYYGVAQPPLQPRRETYVRLLADDATAQHILLQLGRRRQDVEVLLFLAHHPDPLPTVESVLEATGCSSRTLRELAKRGLVVIEPAQTQVVLTLPPAEALAEAEKLAARAPSQAHVLRALATAGGVLSWRALQKEGIARSALRALVRRGWVREVKEPATVRLNVSTDQLMAYALRAKGLETHARVLEALTDVDGPVWVGWLYAETGANRNVLRDLEEAGLVALTREEVIRDPLADKELPPVPETPPPLTPAQEAAWREIREAMVATREPGKAPVFLLHGVTGSGKTEIYLRAVEEALRQGRQVLYLVPEIALTPQTIQRVAARFPGKLVVWHSDLSPGERYDTWRRVKAGEVDIIVGTRSALFAPVSRLGLIVIDEEHDESYKNQRLPYYHARDVALELARRTGSVVLLGSATPDVVTYTRAREGKYRLVELPRRILAYRRHLEAMAQGARDPRRPLPWETDPEAPEARVIPLPPVRVVDMRLELKAGNRSIFSRALQQAIREALEAREQVILFMNRRGQATFVLCRDCGYVLRCDRCDVPLTFHVAGDTYEGDEHGYLLCHHCNRRYENPDKCPACESSRIRYFGGGTQRVAQEVKRLFPHARVLRWDRDVTLERGAHWRILNTFARHEADVLVGTQMLAKGLDLPRVTLVGVISADEGLFLPDFRSAERTFQVLTQVAGRAGRGIWGGRVIIQTYHPEHYAVRAAAQHDYGRFFRHEMAFREQMGYPPVYRMVRLLYTHTRAEKAQQEATRLAADLQLFLVEQGVDDVSLIGPAPCFYIRLRGQYRWHILLRGPDPAAVLRRFPLPPGWRADVDPVNTL